MIIIKTIVMTCFFKKLIFVDLLEKDHIMSKHEHHLLKQCFAQRIFTALQIHHRSLHIILYLVSK